MSRGRGQLAQRVGVGCACCVPCRRTGELLLIVLAWNQHVNTVRNKRKITRDTALNCCREDVLRWAGVFQSESPRAVVLLTYRCSIRLIIADLQTEQEAEFEEVRRPMRRGAEDAEVPLCTLSDAFSQFINW